jgi:hypothetical protein
MNCRPALRLNTVLTLCNHSCKARSAIVPYFVHSRVVPRQTDTTCCSRNNSISVAFDGIMAASKLLFLTSR